MEISNKIYFIFINQKRGPPINTIAIVGWYNKINKFFSKVADAVKDNVLPVLGTIGDFIDSDFTKTVAGYAAPAPNSLVPGLGTGLNSVLPYISQVGKFTRNFSNPKPPMNSVPKGIYLSKRPDNLHNRIELKLLPPPDDYSRPRSFVEELPD
jgi:hypothetical protein